MTVKRIKAKYPIKLGYGQDADRIEAGEEGRMASLEEMQRLFPAIDLNPDSLFCGVVFRDLQPFIVHRKQIEVLDV